MRMATPALLLSIVVLAACGDADRTYTIDEVRPDRAPQIRRGVGLSDTQRLDPRGGRSRPAAGHEHAPDPQDRKLVWKLPSGWKELPTSQYRKANFTLERNSELECYFSLAGGGLVPNLNRWRRQMGLPPATQAEIEALPRHALFKGQAIYVDLKGDFSGMGGKTKAKQRMLGLILPLSPQELLFVKMTGPEALVGEEEANFLAFSESLAVEGAPAEGAPAEGGAGPTSAAGLHWQAPDGWVKVPSRGERLVTYHPAGEKKADCYIYSMVGDAGGLLGNINRWRRQIGSSPLTMAEISALPKVSVLGQDRPILEEYGSFTGMGGEAVEESGLLVVPCFLGSRAVFIKLTGPAQLVREQKEQFLAFCRSVSTESSTPTEKK